MDYLELSKSGWVILLRWLHLVSGSCCADATLADQESEVQVVERNRGVGVEYFNPRSQ